MRRAVILPLVPLFLLTLSASLLAQSATPSINASSIFLEAPEYSSGGQNALSVAVADLNGDGIPDLVVANGCITNGNCSTGDVSVLLGIGNGTFQAPTVYASGGGGANSVAVADVNGDGKPDIVVANCGTSGSTSSGCSNTAPGSVGVLLGNGDGTFRAAVSYGSGGNFAESIAVADVNGDGKLDLLVANQCLNTFNCPNGGDGGVGVLLGNGDGTFRPAVSYSGGGEYTYSVAVADVNNDGRPDLLVTNICSSAGGLSCANAGAGTAGGAAVLLGNGDGTFQTAVVYPSGGGSPLSVVVADVNRDGIPDLVVANQCVTSTDCSQGSFGVLLGNGNGTFQPALSYPSDGQFTRSLVVSDVNGDGKLDVAVASGSVLVSNTDDGVSVFLGNGDGTFQPPLFYDSAGVGNSSGALSLAAADVNRDGKTDLVMTNVCFNYSGSDIQGCAGGGAVAVLMGNGNGTFQDVPSYNSDGGDAGAVADVNGDGIPDLIVATRGPSVGNPNIPPASVGVLLGNGDGTFRPVVTYGSGGWAEGSLVSVTVADLNRDGIPDLIVENACSQPFGSTGFCGGPVNIGVLLGKGDGTFQAAVTYSLGGSLDSLGGIATVADVNGDGIPDVVASFVCGIPGCPSDVISVLLGNGDGTFQPAMTFPSGGYGVAFALGDLNADGKPDLVVTNNYGGAAVSVMLGNGDGTFRPSATYSLGVNGTLSVALADLNGDGKLDLVIADVNGLALMLGNGDGTFQALMTTPIAGGIPASSLAIADFNGDGKLDVAGAFGFLLLGNGDGTFQNLIPLGLGGTNSIVAGDLKGDGSPDLAVGALTILLNRLSPSAPTSTTLTSSLNPSYAGQSLTFTATVRGQGNNAPVGSVAFAINGNPPVSEALINGQATFTRWLSQPGPVTVSARYSGDAINLPSTSASLNQNVIQPVVTLSGSPQQPLTTDSSGNFVAQVTITNTGNVTISSLQVTSATLGSGSLLSAPAAVTNLAPGGSAVVTLTFPPSSAPAGATTAPLKVSGTYTVSSPSLSGNWALSFRSVTL